MQRKKVFVSYSHNNKEKALQIVTALERRDYDVWFDKDDIPPGEPWRPEIARGIENSDAFIFLLSPDSANSEVCNEEIAYAKEQGKRILPVVILPIEMKEEVIDAVPGVIPEKPKPKKSYDFFNPAMKKVISDPNWIYCREGSEDVEAAMDVLKRAVETDYPWVRFHTDLQVRAMAWSGSWLDIGRLVLGNQLKVAEAGLEAGAKKDPAPTALQWNLVKASRRFVKFLWRLGIAVLAAVLITIAVLSARPYVLMERALPGNWVSIPAGPFTMGMNEDEANLYITLCKDTARTEEDKALCPDDIQRLLDTSGRVKDADLPEFRIMDYEVTNAQYKQCVDGEGCSRPSGWTFQSVDINKPATNLTWNEATTYCEWLDGRLPTEGEWEKAARGTMNTTFPWGDKWKPKYANLVNGGSPKRIDAFAATDVNDYSVHDMAGNVMEWTASAYVDHVEGGEFSDPILKPSEVESVYWVIARGGSWRTVASYGMASNRYPSLYSNPDPNIGFRCVCPEGQECSSPWSLWWIWSHSYYPDK